MTFFATTLGSAFARRATGAVVFAALLLLASDIAAQTGPVERTFTESKSRVEEALKQLQPAMSGHLPTLEGFARDGDRPLDHYQRGFYERTVQVKATADGGCVVHVSAKVTAWYSDVNPAHSGYRLLNSNGRLEADLLDQLRDLLSADSKSSDERPPAPAPPATVPKTTATIKSEIAAPSPGLGVKGDFSPGSTQGLSAAEANLKRPDDEKPSTEGKDLRAEIASLEEVLKNQVHPKNLVTVKKSGTAVVASPSLTAKTLFLASAEDEFETLDFNENWVHVRISGLSRGWIWRSDLKMPEGIADLPLNIPSSSLKATDLFQVSREESAPFPGDWEPLRGKYVKIFTVQSIRENEKDGGAAMKLEFAKSVLGKWYSHIADSPGLSGVVLIFDAVDGGLMAATLSTVERWKAGALSDAALWHQCYFDPPETFSATNATGTQ